MGTFKIGEVGEYTPQEVEENEFLNERLTTDTYGIYYSVKFEGDAETFLLQAKKAPVKGQSEWGMIEQSKSGKSMRFKRVKREESSPPHVATNTSKSDKPYLRDVTAIPLDVWRTLIGIQGVPTNSEEFHRFFSTVKEHADELLLTIDKIRGSGDSDNTTSSTPSIKAQPPAATSLGDQFRSAKPQPPPEASYPYSGEDYNG